MRYRVVFAKRFQSDGNESAVNPTADLDVDLPDDVVADKVFVGRFDPDAKHSQEVLDEDDAWLGVAAPEIWEYDVVDGREQDFIDAMRNSETVMEFSVIDETATDAGDLSSTNLADSSAKAPDELDLNRTARQGGSGVRSVDDGPGGQPTGDATADGMGPSRPYLANDEAEGVANEGSGGIDDLSVTSADDPTLGLTDYGNRGPDDWAADTGPTANPGTGVRSRGAG
ncbi:MAG: hypothetical protein JOZ62_10575 [Acidobacteriaceae bacterium]|nr:hypothetical protein [Acidobacteriaceae bacterium]